ncbi:Acetyltransferase (GNAT) family protein [Streptomyces zhaozhouensis]|uniref:Acetyltransferase (GNAT) family protein n=1 Tax=Streptomyces zhaozhouensis TaxID=1300267 RepID=A0A286DWB3_9ACTN|nr:GNAT family N-acetyltransferase [Streptomyces zhaozhouensis]SOD62961.1 Acetyltransferase (GNAT) family protein [Streptomyces zhaozhouensis]
MVRGDGRGAEPTALRVDGAELLRRRAGLRRAYVAAFAGPPWNEDESRADVFVRRLPDEVRRPGFVAALARDGERVLGFATGVTTPEVFPRDRSYGKAAATLGAERTRALLCGGREVNDLAVDPAAAGRGVGRALLAAVTDDVPSGRCWLLTHLVAAPARAFYRRLGWVEAAPARASEETGVVVFLGPRHPGRASVAG